jgi:hypothetical protein
MSPRITPPSIARAAVALVLVVAAGGCGPGTGSSGTAPTPGGSGTAACPAAPEPPGDLAGWGQPAQPPHVVPLLINFAGQLVCGQNRVLFGLMDRGGAPIGSSDRTVSVAFYDLGRDPSKPVASVDTEFVWAIKDVKGIYVANASFPESGRYGAEVTTAQASGSLETVRITFDVQPSSPTIHPGDRAPASKTPTLDQVGGDATHISTDAHPDPAFYTTSVDQALAKHKPFVVIFATPKFCTSAQCGPTLDSIKPYVAKYPTVTFINVEPYKLKLVNGTLVADTDATGQLQPTATTTDEWHLVTEPTVYVVNRDGVVTADFDLIFSDDELSAALDAVK